MKPWKDLTDRFDELSIWLDELEERVEEEEGGGDPSDSIVNIKVSLLPFHKYRKIQEMLIILLFYVNYFISLTSRTTC